MEESYHGTQKQSPGGDLLGVNPEGIPGELRVRPQWVNWRIERRDGKLTKVPYDPRSGKRASSTDLASWSRFEEVFEACQGGGYSGIGFVFGPDPYTGIDLDACRDPETGVLDAWAHSLIERFSEGYIEASPSGTGVHIIVRAKTPHNGKRGNVEVYGAARFFTITGAVIS